VIFGIVTEIFTNVDVMYCLQVSWNVSSAISTFCRIATIGVLTFHWTYRLRRTYLWSVESRSL